MMHGMWIHPCALLALPLFQQIKADSGSLGCRCVVPVGGHWDMRKLQMSEGRSEREKNFMRKSCAIPKHVGRMVRCMAFQLKK
jgi:hypothetical protein